MKHSNYIFKKHDRNIYNLNIVFFTQHGAHIKADIIAFGSYK